jgi:HAD superfamily hydrolase (TIGR01509 family)
MSSVFDIDFTNKKIFIFDLDGTLIDSIGIWNLTDYYLIREYGNINANMDEIQNDRDYYLHNNTTGDIYAGYCNFLINKYNLVFKNSSELSRIRRELYERMYEQEISFKKNVVNLLIKLKELGYITVLATMSSNENIETYANSPKLIKEINIRDVFDLITTKDSVERKKPDPQIYQNILQLFGVDPRECLVFEDSYSGVLASKKAGIETVNVYDKYSDKDRKKINEITDYAIIDYQEIIDALERVFAHKII